MHDPFEPTKADIAATKLTAAERRDALADRGDPKWADEFVLEEARWDKARERKRAEASEFAQLRARVRKIESVLDKLPQAVVKAIDISIEGRGFMRFIGIYDEGRAYRKGDVVTNDGGMWIAMQKAPVGERPGKSIAWRLTAKGDRR